MTTPWYSTRLQVIQAGMQLPGFLVQLAPFLAGVYVAWPAFKANDLLSSGAILFYLLTASVLIVIGLNAYAAYTKVGKGRASDTKTSEGARLETPKREVSIPPIDFPTPDWLKPLTPVINKKYKHETVELDGKEFQHCEFQDVTFVYNGTKQTRFVNCEKRRRLSFSSRNPLVFLTSRIVDTLRAGSEGEGKVELFDGSAR